MRLAWYRYSKWNSILMDKIAAISKTIFQMSFREWKVLYFDYISLKLVPKGPIDNKPVLV